MKINWEDFAIAFVLGLILANFVSVFVLRSIFGIVSMPFSGLQAVTFYLLTLGIPLGFYFFRNRFRFSDSLYTSIIFGVVSLPLYPIIETYLLYLLLCQGCPSIFSPESPLRIHLPFYTGGLVETLVFSVGSSVLIYLLIYLIMNFIQKQRGKPDPAGKTAKRKRKPGNRL